MVEPKKIYLKEEDITFKCANTKCGCNIFTINTSHINGYGELVCPICSSHKLNVIFLNYKKKKKVKNHEY